MWSSPEKESKSVSSGVGTGVCSSSIIVTPFVLRFSNSFSISTSGSGFTSGAAAISGCSDSQVSDSSSLDCSSSITFCSVSGSGSGSSGIFGVSLAVGVKISSVSSSSWRNSLYVNRFSGYRGLIIEFKSEKGLAW